MNDGSERGLRPQGVECGIGTSPRQLTVFRLLEGAPSSFEKDRTQMKKAIAVLCSSVALICGAAAARADTTHTPTTIVTTFIGPGSPGKAAAFGYLQTPPRCRGDRRVKVLFRYGSDPTWTPVDLGRSTGQGAWGGVGAQVGPSGSVTEIKVRVTRETIGRSPHKHICDGDSLTANLAQRVSA
jgi:hypothetical protein